MPHRSTPRSLSGLGLAGRDRPVDPIALTASSSRKPDRTQWKKGVATRNHRVNLHAGSVKHISNAFGCFTMFRFFRLCCAGAAIH